MKATANPADKPATKDKQAETPADQQAPDLAAKVEEKSDDTPAEEEQSEEDSPKGEATEPSPNEQENAKLREQSAQPKEKSYSKEAKNLQAIVEAADSLLGDDAKMIGNRWTAGQPSGAPHDPENYSLVVRIPSVKAFAESLNDAGLDRSEVKAVLPQFRALLGMIGQWVNPKRNTAIVIHPWGAVPYMKFDDETIAKNRKG